MYQQTPHYDRSINTEHLCPDCSEPVSDIYTHFQSGDCSLPHIKYRQQELIEVLLLLGGEYFEDTYTLQYEATSQQFAIWVQNIFGGLAKQVGRTVEIYFGEPLDELYDSLENAHEEMRVEIESLDIPDKPMLEPTPELESPFELSNFEQLCIYAEAGKLVTHGSNTYIQISLAEIDASFSEVISFYYSFSPMPHTDIDGEVVYLSETDKFFTVMDYTPVPGIDQVNWAGSFTPTELLPVERTECPECGGSYMYYNSHINHCWENPPEIGTIEHEFIKGILLGGGFINRTGDGWYIALEDIPTEFARFLDGYFQHISTWILESGDGMCSWGTYPSFLFEEYGGWTDEAVDNSVADRSASQYIFPEPTEFYPGDIIVSVLYVLAGRREGEWVVFDVEHVLTEDVWDSVFRECESVKVSEDGVSVAVDTDSIRSHLQEIPYPGFASKWL